MKPFVIYYDIESQLIEINENNKLNHYQQHKPYNMGIYLLSRYPDLIKSQYIQFNGDDCIIKGLDYIMKLKWIINDILKKTNYPITMSIADELKFKKTEKCWMCNKILQDNDKVRDHNHLLKVNNYRGAACNTCNINANFKNYKLNIIAHNSKNYDAHFLFQYIGKLNEKRNDKNKIKITAIPLTDQKYLSFEVNGCVFLDSNGFMMSSLEKLIDCLNKTNDESLFKNFNEFYKDKTDEQRKLLRQKGYFPYDYYKSNDVLEKGFPEHKDFYNKLMDKNISNEEYEHAKNVYQKLNCKKEMRWENEFSEQIFCSKKTI